MLYFHLILSVYLYFSMNTRVPLRKGYAVCISVCYLMLTKLCLCALRSKTSTIIRSFSEDLSRISIDKSAMKVLNVAEKNDVAKNVAFFLSGGNSRTRSGLSKYNKIYEFQYPVRGQMRQMMMTSVSGHLLNFEFPGNYKIWKSVNPSALFDAPVVKHCPKDYEPIKNTLQKEIRSCDTLIIWTDCDREGENIGFEVVSVCTEVKPTIRVYRAKFSEITARSVIQAINNLGDLNKNISDAVDVRSELDLRIGAAFTRFQTLRLQQVFPDTLQGNVISYGSCQFPTLGFVVERYKAIESFIPEAFWKIQVAHTINDITVNYIWERVRLFDKQCCQALFDRCEERPLAKVEKVTEKSKLKYRPQPLDTIELQKIAARKLKLSGKTTLAVAEKLYTQGFISYPRTETNMFSKDINLMPLVEMQTEDNRWGAFANRVIVNGINPRNGKKSDEAHPPIHPTKYTNSLTGVHATVYEFIVRHFLACVSSDAVGHETTVKIDINGEKFNASGLNIIERNYLEVYPYDTWSSKQIHKYQEGQTFHVSELNMVDGETSPPKLLTEAELIALMDKHGIGTDATHAEHIDKIKSRLYVGLENGIYFVPGHLGIGLVDGYDNMGFQMSKPHLRAELEADLKRICNGEKDPKIVLAEQIEKYREVFRVAQEQASKLDIALSKYLLQTPAPVQDGSGDNGGVTYNTFNPVMKCPQCRSDIVVKTRPNNGGYYLSCMGFPQCRSSMWFPGNVLEVEVHNETCRNCGPGVKLLKFKFRPDSMKPYYPNTYIGCISGCDPDLLDLMEVRPLTATSVQPVQNSGGGNVFQLNRHPVQGHFTRANSDDSSSDSRHQSTQQARRPVQSDATGDGEVNCNCGVPAKKLTVAKESVNKGRKFYSCSQPQNQRCNFFQWADDGPLSAVNTERRNNQPQFRGRPFDRGSSPSRRGGQRKRPAPSQGRVAAPRRCGLCGEIGHTRRNCPQA